MPPDVEPELIASAAALAGREPLLIVGGTFDPPHRAHVSQPAVVRNKLWQGRGWIVYVPAARSPLKDVSAATSADRLAMLGLALNGTPNACIWSFEVDRPSPSFSVDTLGALRAALGPAAEVRLLIGTDQALDFHRWRDFREVIALAEPVVVPRAPYGDPDSFAAALTRTEAWTEADVHAWKARLVRTPLVDASATQVRALLLRNPRPVNLLRGLLPNGVLEYIEGQRLYR